MTKAEFKKLPRYETLDEVFAAIKDGTIPKDVTFMIDNDSFSLDAFVIEEGEECGDSESIFHLFPCTSEDLLMRVLNDLVGVKAEGV